MKKWILVFVVAMFGCASHRTRVTVSMVRGEPSVSVEFEDRENDCERKLR